MPKEKIEVMVEGGKATAAPPLGPALGPMGVPIQQVIDDINKKTKDLNGMQVPVTVTVDTKTKDFKIEVGSPPVSALIKKELGLKKAASLPGSVRAGDLTEEQARKIASAKFGSSDDRFVNQVKGSARSMGVTIGQGELSEEEKKELDKSHKDAAEISVAAAPAEGAAEGAAKEGAEAKEGETGEKPEGKPEGAGEGKKEEPKEEKPEEGKEK